MDILDYLLCLFDDASCTINLLMDRAIFTHIQQNLNTLFIDVFCSNFKRHVNGIYLFLKMRKKNKLALIFGYNESLNCYFSLAMDHITYRTKAGKS